MFPESRESIKKDQESISPHETPSLIGSLTQPELVECLGGGMRVLRPGLVVGVLFQKEIAQKKASQMVSLWRPMKRMAYVGAALEAIEVWSPSGIWWV